MTTGEVIEMPELRWQPYGKSMLNWQETLVAMAEYYGTHAGMWHDNEFWALQSELAAAMTEEEAQAQVEAIHADAQQRSEAWHAEHPVAPPEYLPDAPRYQVLIQRRGARTAYQDGAFQGTEQQAQAYAEARRAAHDADRVSLLPTAGIIEATFQGALVAAERALLGDVGPPAV